MPEANITINHLQSMGPLTMIGPRMKICTRSPLHEESTNNEVAQNNVESSSSDLPNIQDVYDNSRMIHGIEEVSSTIEKD